MGAKDYVPRLVGLLKDEQVVHGAALGLGLLRAREHAGALAPLLKADDSKDRHVAIEALALMGAKEYGREIARLLLDEQRTGAETKQAAAFALARLGS